MQTGCKFMRSFSAAIFWAFILCGCGGGCSGRGVGNAEQPADGGSFDADIDDECTDVSDCVLAVPYDCCLGCPQVMTRNDLAAETCFYDSQDSPPDDIPLECLVECYACPTCFPQPLDVACASGRCVADGWGCPGPTDEVYPPATVAEIRADQDAYAHNTYTVSGVIFPDSAACTDLCPASNCCSSALLLDGGIYLSRRPCDLEMMMWSDRECADAFHANQLETEGLLPGHHYEFVGEVRPTNNPWATPALRVQAIRVLDDPSQGFSISGGYEVTVLAVEEDATDPTCTPARWAVGDTARVYVAVADRVRVFAPFFSCLVGGLFEGTQQATNGFDTAVPIDCDGCCCDYFLRGTVDGDTLDGQYESFDGTCRYIVDFSGARL